MAKSLPYFKFIVSEWSDGDITLESFEVQGLFINICAYYWSNEGNISLEKTKKKFKCDDENYNILVESEIIKVIDGKIKISFMDEQLNDRDSKALINKKNGKKGGRPRNPIETEEKPNGLFLETETKANTKALRKEKKREEEIREEKKKETKKEIAFSNDIESCYNSLIEYFNTKPKDKKASDNWKDCIKQLNENHKVKFSDLIYIVSKARSDEFWSKNFMSLLKLIKKNKEEIYYIDYFIEKFGVNPINTTTNQLQSKAKIPPTNQLMKVNYPSYD